jgi:hypothetical protein
MQREKEAKEREARERKLEAEKAEQQRKESEAAAAARAKERAREREKEEERERERQKEVEKEEIEKEKEKRKALEREKAKQKANDEAASGKPPHPTARTETDDDAYSFRPYDRPKKSVPKAGSTASTYSASSYAASQSTARTTPPPSHRGPYSTKDPDKIIIKAVYSFNNAFQRTPVAQLISGQGNVTDGLILRITTEGLFIDDDVRGVPQREWDVKAWTMKMAEVWRCGFLEAPFLLFWF